MKNCAELFKSGQRITGVYKIDPDGLGAFEVFCDQKSSSEGWTVFQKRLDGSFDFVNRSWADCKRGFGNLNGEFWLGMDKIHRLTKTKTHKEIQLMLNMTCSLFPAKETNTDLALGYIPVSAHNLWIGLF